MTAVRDPLARNVSAFFEVLEYYTASEKKKKFTSTELLKIYYEKLPHDYPLNWFDNEIGKYTGIDVFKYEFDTQKKYKIIEKDNVKLLILRTDADDETKKEAIFKTSNIKLANIPTLNNAQHKYYKVDYQQFIQDNTFSNEYIIKMLNHKLTNHFFSKEEVELLKNKWGSTPT